MSLLVDKEPEDKLDKRQEYEACLKQLLQSSWCGLLSALSLLLDASTEDSTTETILKHLVGQFRKKASKSVVCERGGEYLSPVSPVSNSEYWS